MRLEKQREQMRAQAKMETGKRKNKPRGEPVGATVSGHAPHDIVERIGKLVDSGAGSRSAVVVAALTAGLPAVEAQHAKRK